MRVLPGAWLEPLLQELRIWKIRQFLPLNGVLVDIGCDDPQVLINKVSKQMKKCIGLDIVVQPQQHDNVQILRQDLQKKIELPTKVADAVTLLAVLEHMKHPQQIISEAYRILKPGGVLLVTVPSLASKPVLEVFAKIALVRDEMIDQHENYFSLQSLRDLAETAGFSQVFVVNWELGYNVFLRAIK